MKPIIQLLWAFLFLCCPLFSHADEIHIEYGEIIETSGDDNNYIQVRDKILKVTSVYVNSGDDFSNDGENENEPLEEIDKSSLKEGDIVHCFITEQKTDYWETEKVILLEGTARTKYLVDSELKLIHDENTQSAGKKVSQAQSAASSSQNGQDKKEKAKTPSKIYLEDGVWKN